MDPRQAEALAKIRAGDVKAYLVIYEDGTEAVIRDDGRSMKHATSAHGVRFALGVLLPSSACNAASASTSPGELTAGATGAPLR